jgi:hypothetical protein
MGSRLRGNDIFEIACNNIPPQDERKCCSLHPACRQWKRFARRWERRHEHFPGYPLQPSCAACHNTSFVLAAPFE